MKNLLSTLLFIFSLIGFNNFGLAQCVPESVDNCDDSNILCSLDELNGYTCSNPNYSNPTGCSPLCPSGGGSHNTAWWGFVTDGGAVTITITYSNCSVNGTGVQMGIWGDCDCAESVACNPNCTGPGQYTIQANLTACKNYYLFVDGCSGDVCDFSIQTSGGSQPEIKPLGKINNDDDRFITTCAGNCNNKFKVAGEEAGCEPNYEWTLDGQLVGSSTNEIDLDFQDTGEFTLCVVSYIGNLKSHSLCSQQGPQCATIQVINRLDSIMENKHLCPSELPYVWFNQKITKEGSYTIMLNDQNCCASSATLNLTIEPQNPPVTINYFNCDQMIYQDPTNHVLYPGCNKELKVIFPDGDSLTCDSFYILNTISPKVDCQWIESCDSNYVSIIPQLMISGVCDADITKKEFKWYRQSDSAQTMISHDSILRVNQSDIYCLQYDYRVQLDQLSVDCSQTFCDTFNDATYFPKFIIVGDLTVENGKLGSYTFKITNGSSTNIKKFKWNVSGSRFIIMDPIDSTKIYVSWDSTTTDKKICLTIESVCFTSPEICTDVFIDYGVAVRDINIDNVSIYPVPNNGQFVIVGMPYSERTKIEIISLNGKKYFDNIYSMDDGKISIDLFGLGIPNATYFIRITQNKNAFTKKLILMND